MVNNVSAHNRIHHHIETQIRPRSRQSQKPTPQAEITNINPLIEMFSNLTLISRQQTQQMQCIEDQTTVLCHFTTMIREQTEQMRRQTEVLAEESERMRKLLLIATRIAAGDNVPPQDKEFLMTHAPDMYRIAISARVENDNPQNHESVLEESE
ncbi:MAG: hypothetical protein FWB80_10255 [Defluviitaleaceae bacterium]|nr:hypothetical protein [Defluviitaleaceae bacterium]MCL2199295.1 hypothetical protein [Defluviitaleaceae bacterium]